MYEFTLKEICKKLLQKQEEQGGRDPHLNVLLED